MSEVTIDLTNYKDRVGGRVEPGRYRVIVDDAEQVTAKSGNPMINLFLRVLDGPSANTTIVDRLVITENSLFRVVGFLQAVGIPVPRRRIRISTQQLTGRVLEIDIEDGEPYNGRVKSEVRGYMAVEGASASASDEDWDSVGSAAPAQSATPTDAVQAASAPTAGQNGASPQAPEPAATPAAAPVQPAVQPVAPQAPAAFTPEPVGGIDLDTLEL